jgi:hypothetical protein
MKTYLMFCFMLICSAFVVSCYAGGGKVDKKQAQIPIKGKVGAPVSFNHKLIGDQLNLSITFLNQAKSVTVLLKGLDGLVVEAQVPAQTTFNQVEKNQSLEFGLRIEAPEGLSYVSVQVFGIFNGAHRGRAYAVPVGEMSSMQKQQNSKSLEQAEDGTSVHILPAQTNW